MKIVIKALIYILTIIIPNHPYEKDNINRWIWELEKELEQYP